MVRTHMNRGVPVKSKLWLILSRQRLDVSRLSRRLPKARDHPALIFRIGIIGIGRVGEGPEAVTSADHPPVSIGDSIHGSRRAHSPSVFLQFAEEVVRNRHFRAPAIQVR